MYVCTYMHMYMYTVTYMYTFLYHLLFFSPRFYLTARDYPWILKTKRPDKLRDVLKEVEVWFRKVQAQQHLLWFSNPFQQL